jgi:hypothetical protein
MFARGAAVEAVLSPIMRLSSLTASSSEPSPELSIKNPPPGSRAISCRPLRFGVKSLDVRARQAAIALCRNGRLCRPRAGPPAFARRSRPYAGGAPDLPGDGISPRPPNFSSADLTGRDFSGLTTLAISANSISALARQAFSRFAETWGRISQCTAQRDRSPRCTARERVLGRNLAARR